MRQGPEFQPGWRASFEVEGVKVRIEAFHNTRRRFPKGNELVRQAASGMPYEMVKETDYSWRVFVPNFPMAEIRPNPNGSFYVPALRDSYRTLMDAAKRYAERHIPSKAEPQVDEPSSPAP